LIAKITQIMKAAPAMLKKAGTKEELTANQMARSMRMKQKMMVMMRAMSCISLGGSIIPYCISSSICPAEQTYHKEGGKKRDEYAAHRKHEIEHWVRIADNPAACHAEKTNDGSDYSFK